MSVMYKNPEGRRAILETAHCKDMLIRNPDAADLKALAMEEPDGQTIAASALLRADVTARQSSPSTNIDATLARPSTVWSRPNAS